MKVFFSSTYLDLIEHRKAAHCTAGAKARAQFMEVLQTRSQPEGLPCAEAGFLIRRMRVTHESLSQFHLP